MSEENLEEFFENQYESLMALNDAGRVDNPELDPKDVADTEEVVYG